MIRLSARGALIWYLKGGRLFGIGCFLNFFQKQPNAQNKTLTRSPFTRDLPCIASILFTRVKFTRDCLRR